MKLAQLATGGLAAALAIGAFAVVPAAAQTYITDPPGTVYDVEPIYEPAPVYGSSYGGGYVVAPQRRVIVEDPEPVVMMHREQLIAPAPEPYVSTIGVRSNFDDARMVPYSARVSPSGRLCRTVEVEGTGGLLRQHTYCN